MSMRTEEGARTGRRLPALLALVLVAGALGLGCEEKDLGLAVDVYFPCNQYLRTSGLSPFEDVSYVETCLLYSQTGLDTQCSTQALASGKVEFPDVQLGKPLRVSVEGRAVREENGEPLAYGQTAPVIANDSELQKVDLMVSLVDRFGTATDRTNCSGLSCKCSQMRVPRKDFTATVLHDGRVLLAGGRDATNNILDSAEIYDPSDGTFRYVASRLNFARAGHAAVRLGSSYGYRVLLLGGESADQQWRIAEYYDPSTNGFYKMDSPMSSSRIDFTATRLNDGRVLIAGGWKGAEPNKEYLDTMEIYNPARDEFQGVSGVMSTGRAYHTATLTTVGRPNSQVLIAGGRDKQVVLSSADVVEIGNMDTNANVTGRNMEEARWGHAAVRVGLGDKVLVVGGSSQLTGGGIGVLTSMEMFVGFGANPDFEGWNEVDGIPELSIGRFGLTVTPLEPDPDLVGVTTRALLVIGGLDAAPSSVALAEVLIPDDPEDPKTFIVDSAAARAIRDSRFGHRDVKLPSGSVIALGGLWRDNVKGQVEVLDTAEIYEPGPLDWCGSRACDAW